MAEDTKIKATGYDKYVNWKIFFIPVALLFVILLMPTPYGMQDVGTEYKVGPKAVVNFLTETLFQQKERAAEQWELACAQIMEQNMQMGALGKKAFSEAQFKMGAELQHSRRQGKFRQSHGLMSKSVSAMSITWRPCKKP